MIKVLFVCHGNICRSPMAEFLFKDYVAKKGLSEEFYIESAATSSEELGNPVHPGTRRILARYGIDCSQKRARKIKYSDYDEFDYIVFMDRSNLMRLYGMFQGKSMDKIILMLKYTSNPRDVADPWYTGDFEKTYDDIMEGIEGLFKEIYVKRSDSYGIDN